jgi:DNA-binding NarL/FixJ family response regulator
VRVFIVFRDTIYASGLHATLSAAAGVESVGQASSVASALQDAALREADVIVLDGDAGGAAAFVREVSLGTRARILLCNGSATSEVVEAIGDGVAGALARDVLTPDTLLAAVRAVAAGIFALDAGALRALVASGSPPPERAGPAAGQVTAREQMVLSLVAAGLSNREIAERLSYSERTIKTALHDIIAKLGVRSRSQAVAMAVRERMI